MRKEYLEALEWLLANETIYKGKTRLPISPALRDIKQYLESIDNAKPSEALEKLNELLNWNGVCKAKIALYYSIKQALLKTQEQEKALSIILKKRLPLGEITIIKQSANYNEYNIKFNWANFKDISIQKTEEEFDIVKRYLDE